MAQAKAIKKPIAVDFEFATEDGEIETLEGKMTYQKGDAIMTGVKGEKYPCRRDIFDQTYDVVGNPENPKNESEKEPTTATCEFCKKRIEIRSGNFVHVYIKPSLIHAYHLPCRFLTCFVHFLLHLSLSTQHSAQATV